MPRLLAAYTDALSYRAGELVQVHASAPAPAEASVSLVRLRGALAEPPAEPEPLPWALDEVGSVAPQSTCRGGHLTADLDRCALTAFTAGIFLWFASPTEEAQGTVLSLTGTDHTVWVGLDRGRLSARFETGDSQQPDGGVGRGAAETLTLPTPLDDHTWYLILCGADQGALRLSATVTGRPGGDALAVTASRRATYSSTSGFIFDRLALAALPQGEIRHSGPFAIGHARSALSAKLEAPFLAGRVLTANKSARLCGDQGVVEALEAGGGLVAAWDLSLSPGTSPSSAPNLVAGGRDAALVNGPTRAVTGRRWRPGTLHHRSAPEEYGAVHFHATDLVDAGWPVVASGRLPEDLPSGVYGVQVRTAQAVDTTPIVVVPGDHDRPRPVRVVLPTFTYLAYANERFFEADDNEIYSSAPITYAAVDELRRGDDDLGRSLYDTHSDGSGVTTSTAHRPILNMRADYRMWLTGGPRGLSADLLLLDWLEAIGVEYDVVTDHELHRHGATALAGSRVVVTGSHPEYSSEQLLDALQAHRDSGGHLMYLGGNGFYWITGVVADDPLVVEIRRGYAGVRDWESAPGELDLASTGGSGGLWRHQGRPPQKLVGVGFCAQGWGSSGPYRVDPAVRDDPAVAWIVDGVDADVLGDSGIVGGGAAGDELDRADHRLGTPKDAVVITSSFGHDSYYQRAIEELPMLSRAGNNGLNDPDVRADIVYFQAESGGQVFSVGSIAWSGALGGEPVNAVSRMTRNVLQHFIG